MDVQSIQSALNQVRGGGTPRPDSLLNEQDPLREVAKEFEALFTQMMFDSMRETVNREDSLFSGGQGEKVFEDMLYEQYSLITADGEGIGLGDMIYDQFSRNDSTASAATTSSEEGMDVPNRQRIQAYDSLQPELP
ncbi:MAG: rod-binding protein [Spirochaetales bacterium]